MKADRIEIREEAVKDLKKAYVWYEDKKRGLGEDFLKEAEEVLDHIFQNPEAFQAREPDLRQVPLHRFPYVLIYGLIKNIVIVYAVFHTRLNPNKKP